MILSTKNKKMEDKMCLSL